MTSTAAERQYWRRKLPARFQLVLESLGRALIRANPDDLYTYAAVYLERKLTEHTGNSRTFL